MTNNNMNMSSEYEYMNMMERWSEVSGETLNLPSAWLHAVYTPEDSLVFGGNYLHTCAVHTQWAVWRLERAARVDVESPPHPRLVFALATFGKREWIETESTLALL